MKALTAVYKTVDFVLRTQSKRITKKKRAVPVKKAQFIAPPQAKSDKFLLGFSKESILPDDVDKKKYYVAGYGENNPAQGVLDPPHTHAVWLDDLSGKGGIVLVSIDNVGMLNKDVNRLRARLRDFAMLSGCRSINIVSTHSHAGIDTMGIWGPLPLSGKDPKYMELVFSQTVKAVKRHMQTASPADFILVKRKSPICRRISAHQ